MSRKKIEEEIRKIKEEFGEDVECYEMDYENGLTKLLCVDDKGIVCEEWFEVNEKCE